MDEQSVGGAPGKLIFVVEDDQDICALIRLHLRSAGYQVDVFLSGATVIQEALNKLPALFVLDIMLPGADGFDLCRQIRQNDSLARTPIIFLTARGAESDRIQAFELGADDFITKPFSPRELVGRVRAVLTSCLTQYSSNSSRPNTSKSAVSKSTILR